MKTIPMNRHATPQRNDSGGHTIEAKTMVIALIGAAFLCGFQFHQGQLTGVGFAWRVLLATFLGAGAGRLIEIALVHFRRTRIR